MIILLNKFNVCSQCGTIVKKNFSVRIHDCPVCGCYMDRDFNASLNILSLGLQTLGFSAPGSPQIYLGE